LGIRTRYHPVGISCDLFATRDHFDDFVDSRVDADKKRYRIGAENCRQHRKYSWQRKSFQFTNAYWEDVYKTNQKGERS
jgi:hypothetical protein